MESLYNENSIIGSLFKIFNKIFLQATKPTRNLLAIFLIGLLANEHFLSVRNLHHTALSQICNKSLNSYYHALSTEKITNDFIRQAVTRIALSIIPDGKNVSSQEFRHQISTMIQREIFFDSLAHQAQSTKKSDSFINSLKSLIRTMSMSA